MNKMLIGKVQFASGAGKLMQRFNVNRIASGILLIIVMWQWGSAGWIFAKARLAQWLIAESWAETLASGQGAKPWPWADTFPVARLQLPAMDIDLYILEGAQGNSLAFGPGHLQGTALPGEGMSVIGGHRDTHFHFLKNLKPGALFELERRDGRRISYRLATKDIVDIRTTPLYISDSYKFDVGSSLVLVTCYPFDSINPNGPLRMVVRAYQVDASLQDNPQSAEINLDYAHRQQTLFSL